ncbi:MAG: BON domain-containing protein [Calditrichaeota bacterium]|nr:BON domain-containing protein [Calditrichota bacterium]
MKTLGSIWRKSVVAIFAFVLLLGLTTVNASQSSKALQKRIEDAMANYYPQDFKIKVGNNGKVGISGDVNSLYDRYRVFEIVSTVKGVKEIDDNLVVDTQMIPDAMIADNAKMILGEMHSILEPERIQIKVDQGVVFLDGEVSFHRERLAAVSMISQLKGVKGIVDRIKLLPPKKAVSDSNLRIVLGDIMASRFGIEKNVQTNVKNGNVTLNGTVSTLWTRRQIAEEFSKVKGVRKVVNNLKVVEEE